MRALDTGFAEHIAGCATTLCTCWRLTRTDGTVLGFTDHDAVLSFDGTSFEPASGGDSSDGTVKLGGATDTTDLVAVLTSEAISENDIRLGRYDRAVVQTYRVNWRDPEMRHLMRRDRIGEITLEDQVFRAELRSAQADLNRRQGRYYQALCSTRLGMAACGIDANDPAYRAAGAVLSVEGTRRLRVSGISGFAVGWFSFGRLTWSSGNKIDLGDSVATHGRDSEGDWFDLDNEISEWVASGDTFAVTAGCDRLFSTCRDRFGNSVNFRGFPHIPGNDFVLSYPKQGDALNGAPLVR